MTYLVKPVATTDEMLEELKRTDIKSLLIASMIGVRGVETSYDLVRVVQGQERKAIRGAEGVRESDD